MAADDYNPVSLSSLFFVLASVCAFTLFDLFAGCSEIVSGLCLFMRDKVLNSPSGLRAPQQRKSEGRGGEAGLHVFFEDEGRDDKSAHVTLAAV